MATHTIDVLARFPDENPNPVMRSGKGGLLLYANKASAPLLKQWGCKEGGTLPWEWKNRIDKALSSQEPFSADESCGKRIYAIDIVPIKDADYANVYGRDITESKQAEEILRENEERLMILFDFAPDAYYISDLKGNFVDGNKAAEELIGYNRDELIGKNYLTLKILGSGQIKKASLLLVKNLMKKSTGPDEFVLNRKNGSQVTVEIRTHPVTIHNKTLVLGIARDITERKRTEEALRESEEKFRNYIESAPDGIFIVDDAGRYIEANESACRITGYSKEEIEQMSIRDLLAEESLEDGMGHFKELMETGAATSDLWHKQKDGSKRCLTIDAVRLSKTKFLGFCKDITERKRAEEELRESKALVDAVVENVPLMIFLKEATDLRFVIFNRAGEELLGYDRKTLLGKNNLDLFPPEQAAHFMAKDREVLDGEVGLLDIPEEPIQTAKKGQRLLHTRKVCIRGADGTTKYLLGISEDITERKRVEEELINSEGKFRAIFDNASDGMFLVDMKARKFFMCNTACERMLGYTQEEFSNLDIADVHPEESLPFIFEQIGKFSRGEEGIRNDIQFKRKDGSTFTTDASPALLTIAEKKYLLMIFRDITERRRAEEMLRKSEERFRQAINATEEGLWEWDILSGQEFFSSRWCEIIGYSFDDPELSHTYNSWAERIHPDDSERVSRSLKRHLEEGTKYDVDYQHRHKSGEYRWQNSKGHAIFNERGKPTKMVGCISDITDRKRVEEKLKSLLKEKEVLVREIHHRVKNNFMVVSSLLGLQSQQIEDETIQNMFMKSRDRIKSMSLIHERLYKSQDLTHINFAEYIRTLAADLYVAYETDSAKVSLVVEVEDVSIDVDQAIPCGLVLNELISNALKYGFPSGWNGEGRIEITLRRIAENEIELAVKNNGVGLPDDFDIKKTKSLGMKIIALLAEDQLGGKLKVVKNGGTGFIVRFNVEK